jgi:starvation-inducible outer membrane lipoprotein
MKKLLLASAIVLLACCSSIPKGGAQSPPQPTPQTAAALAGDSFTGTIVGGRMGGAMANPRLIAEVQGEDGMVVTFTLRKSTAVTEIDGRTIRFMKGFKKNRRVEIKFVVKDGKNEAVAWHYIS